MRWRTLAVILCLLAVVGCGTGLQYNRVLFYLSNPWIISGIVATAIAVPVAVHDDGFDSGRLEVNDYLRAACIDTGYVETDEEILLLLEGLEAKRLEGMDSGEAMGEADDICRDSNSPCATCMATVIDQIYFYDTP